MHKGEQCDIIALLKSACLSLQSIADSRSIRLEFINAEEEIKINYPEKDILTGFTKLLCAIIDYMPDDNAIYISTELVDKSEEKHVSIKIRNTGINLKQVPAITNNNYIPVKLFSFSAKETIYEVRYSLSGNNANENKPTANGGPFNYTNFVKGIKTHFSRLNNPIERLAETKPKEAAFLTSINNCILKHLDDEKFDANALSCAMAMSRAQLLRRLKSITGNSPAYYIKNLRLAKAKDLLETTDVTISEAAYQTGFNSPSNFSKVFTEKYGITPSQFRRPKPDATNE